MTDTAEDQYLIWSNEHEAWWRPNFRGYTSVIELAGRYDLDAARRIVSKASLDGKLNKTALDPFTGRSYVSAPEVMVVAPPMTVRNAVT